MEVQLYALFEMHDQNPIFKIFSGTQIDTRVVYHLHQKPIWFQTVQMERKNFDWKIPFGFHFP